MAIIPPSDLILDVARAVDPLSYSQAAEKLARAGSSQAADPTTFSELFEEISSPPEPFVRPDPATLLTTVRNNQTLAAGGSASTGGPYEKFEAFVLQSFLQSMLPQSSPALFGSGAAGDMWRSMLAEQIGAELARSGGIGVAERLAASESSPPLLEASRGGT